MLHIRPARLDDSDEIFAWRNDSETIQMSISRSSVTLSNHRAWFSASLSSERTHHLVGELTGNLGVKEKIGVCRFDINDDGTWVVSINLNPVHRGKGFSRALLNHAIDKLGAMEADKVLELRAIIRQENVKSIALFTGCRFTIDGHSDGVISMSRKLFQKDSSSTGGPVGGHDESGTS